MKNIQVGNIIIRGKDSKPSSYDTSHHLEEMKDGWRLPTLNEALYFIQFYKRDIGDFKSNSEYLTSTKMDVPL